MEYTIGQTGERLSDAFFFKKSIELSIFKDEYNFIIIDDKKKDMDLFECLVRNETNLAFRLTRFFDVQKAFHALESKIVEPDLIILDLVMPGMNGNMVLKHLKLSEPTCAIPVVIHSSMSYYGNIKNVVHLDAHAFFPKPVDPHAFEQFVMGHE